MSYLLYLTNHVHYSFFHFIEKLGGVKVRTTHKLSTDVFNSIVKLGSGLKKKKKKGKKVGLDFTVIVVFINHLGKRVDIWWL